MDFLKPIIRDYFAELLMLIAFFLLVFIASSLHMLDSHLTRKHQVELLKIEATKCR